MEKSRPESSLRELESPEIEQQQQICRWMLTPDFSGKKVAALIAKQFTIHTSYRARDQFYQQYVALYLLHRRQQVAGVAGQLTQESRRQPGKFSAATIDMIEQRALEMATNPMVDPKELKAIFS